MKEPVDQLRKACPILGCQSRIKYEHFACVDHWYELPASLRSKLYHAQRNRVRTGKMLRYIDALSECHEAWRELGYGIE